MRKSIRNENKVYFNGGQKAKLRLDQEGELIKVMKGAVHKVRHAILDKF